MTEKYALLTVSNREGVVKFARDLRELKYTIVASEGTHNLLRTNGVASIPAPEYAGQRAVMQPQGIKLINPKIFGGILADLSDPSHLKDIKDFGIYPFSIVACNFYPFHQDPKIMNIDIGGPAMVRCAAKNHERVTVIVDPDDYGMVLDELKSKGTTSYDTRLRLAIKGFQKSINHDQEITEFLRRKRSQIA